MREELQTIIAFVEGKIDGPELGRRLSANPAGFEAALGDGPDLPPEGHLGENVEATRIAVYFSPSGQICGEVKDLPPGTPISSVTIQ